MDVIPTTPKPRPTRGKSGAVKTAATSGKAPIQSGPGRKVSAAEPEIIERQLVEVSAALGADVNQHIATTAYFLAAARNFEPGHELEDWLEAERRVGPPTDRA